MLCGGAVDEVEVCLVEVELDVDEVLGGCGGGGDGGFVVELVMDEDEAQGAVSHLEQR